ncbi:hypothetical protein NKG94_11710 [Micromonospora sp. M12]
MKRTATTILVTAALLLAATGCGGDDSTGSTNADGSKQVTLTSTGCPTASTRPSTTACRRAITPPRAST